MKLVFRRNADALVPTDEAGLKALGRIADGDLVVLELLLPRNIKLLAKFWKLAEFITFHTERFQTKQQCATFLKIAVGHCDWVQSDLLGNVPVARSISRGAMDDAEFENFWNRVCDFVARELLPVTAAELEAELAEFVGAGAAIWRDQ